MLGVGLAGAGQAMTALVEKNHIEAGLTEVAKYMDLGQAMFRTANLRGSLNLALTLGLIGLIVFMPLTLLLRYRVSWARLPIWLAGIGLAIGEIILMAADSSAVKTGRFVTDIDVPGGRAETVDMLNGMLVPSWFPPLHYVFELLVLVGAIAVCIQILRPGVAGYVRREAEVEESSDDRVWSFESRKS
jgi:hypothetical protein